MQSQPDSQRAKGWSARPLPSGPAKPLKPSEVAHRIYFLPIYADIVRAVRYDTVPCAEVIAKLKDVIAKHGQPKVDATARDLLDYEQVGQQLCAKLKPHLRVQCRQILGPLPEEAEEFWKNADGSRPKNAPPQEAKPKKRIKQEAPQPEPADTQVYTRTEMPDGSIVTCRPAEPPVVPSPEQKPVEPTPVLTSEQLWLQAVSVPGLTQRLREVCESFRVNGPKSFLGKRAKVEIVYLEAEFGRRGLKVPKTPKPALRKRRPVRPPPSEDRA